MLQATPYGGPAGLAVTGVILLIVAAVLNALLPILGTVAGILTVVGWICLAVAAVWAVVILLRGGVA